MKKTIIFKQNPYVDMSLISPISFLKGKRKLSRKKKKYILAVFDKYDIKKEDILITNKLFVEIIGEGQIKKQAYKDPTIRAKRKKLEKIISQQTFFSDNNAKELCKFLENNFKKSIKDIVPQSSIYSIAIKNLKKYRLHKSFKQFDKKVQVYAMDLERNTQLYNRFIFTVVCDAVISFILTMINFKNIPLQDKKKYKFAVDILQRFLHTVLLQYVPKGLLQHDLARVMAGLDFCISSHKERVKKVDPILYPKDDIADSEHQSLAFYGHEGASIIVFSGEPIKDIMRRLRWYNTGIVTIVNSIKNPLLYFSLLGKHPHDFNVGKIVVINYKKLKCVEINFNPGIDFNVQQATYRGFRMRKCFVVESAS